MLKDLERFDAFTRRRVKNFDQETFVRNHDIMSVGRDTKASNGIIWLYKNLKKEKKRIHLRRMHQV